MSGLYRAICRTTRNSRFWKSSAKPFPASAKATKDAHPEIPWPEIIGLRNRIVHVYFEIDLDIVWNIVNDDVPTLIRELERIAPPDSR